MQERYSTALRHALLLSLTLLGGPAAWAATLFDPALGTTPVQQGWNQLGFGSFGQTGSGLIDLDTTAIRLFAGGYFSELPADGSNQHPNLPLLDRNPGFRLDFALHVISEGHNLRDDNGDGKFDRAGFSLIALGDDLQGVEIGFFSDRVWIYEDATPVAGNRFTQAEFALFDTSAGLVNYSLLVSGDSYSLSQNGSLLLNGALRQYAPSGVAAAIDPYDNPSFIFLGDDTGSADAHVLIGAIAAAAVPLPPALLLFALPALLLGRRRR